MRVLSLPKTPPVTRGFASLGLPEAHMWAWLGGEGGVSPALLDAQASAPAEPSLASPASAIPWAWAPSLRSHAAALPRNRVVLTVTACVCLLSSLALPHPLSIQTLGVHDTDE